MITSATDFARAQASAILIILKVQIAIARRRLGQIDWQDGVSNFGGALQLFGLNETKP